MPNPPSGEPNFTLPPRASSDDGDIKVDALAPAFAKAALSPSFAKAAPVAAAKEPASPVSPKAGAATAQVTVKAGVAAVPASISLDLTGAKAAAPSKEAIREAAKPKSSSLSVAAPAKDKEKEKDKKATGSTAANALALPKVGRPELSSAFIGELCKAMPGLAEKLAPKVEPKAASFSKSGSPAPPAAAGAAAAAAANATPAPEPEAPGAAGGAGSSHPAPLAVGLQQASRPAHVPGAPLPVGKICSGTPSAKSEIDPERGLTIGVRDLCDNFSIGWEVAILLDKQLKDRVNSYDGDVETIWDTLEVSKTPAATLMVKIKELQQGTFQGLPVNYKALNDLAAKFKLDEQAQIKLTDVMSKIGKERARIAMSQLEKLLELSNKPSALVMMHLGPIKRGEDLAEPTHKPAPGSWLWEKREAEKEAKGAKGASRSGDQGKGKGGWDRGGSSGSWNSGGGTKWGSSGGDKWGGSSRGGSDKWGGDSWGDKGSVGERGSRDGRRDDRGRRDDNRDGRDSGRDRRDRSRRRDDDGDRGRRDRDDGGRDRDAGRERRRDAEDDRRGDRRGSERDRDRDAPPDRRKSKDSPKRDRDGTDRRRRRDADSEEREGRRDRKRDRNGDRSDDY